MKGKYAKRAAVRREAAEVEATEEVYKRNIVRLTKERDEARAARDEAIGNWRKEVRILRAQLAEGTSPRVDALTRESNRLRKERDDIDRQLKEFAKRINGVHHRITDHLVGDHKMTDKEALGHAHWFITGVHASLKSGTDVDVLRNHGYEVLKTLRKARGE